MAIRNPRLPLLPGYGTNPMIGKTNFGVRPIFTTIDKVNMLVDKPEGVNRVPSLYCRKQAPDLPTWVMYDKNILRFQAFFQQTLLESRASNNILRKVVILFFLEDGTIKVIEPRTENSGLSQGTLIRRQRIRLPFSYDLYYDVLDLNIGREVTFFGKVFKIVNCDNFTRVFLNRLGINVPDPINWPDAIERTPDTSKPPKHRPFRQFLDFDRQVLRFHGYWDDRDSEFGTIHLLEIHYFLADDTIEIKEVLPPNSGMEAGPMFLKRMKIPRKIPSHIEMTGGPQFASYSPADLSIGAVINVYGRKVVLTDCDPFTKEYYRVTYGFDAFTPLPLPKDEGTECISSNMAERQLPPWNGYGSYDDSAENCRTVEPKAPHRDFMKFLNKDRVGFDSHILRFAARLINDNPVDAQRYFIIKYFLCDDTIGIFELGERNSGFKGGRFFRRDKMYLPDVEFFVPKEPPAYTDKDMWVGNELVINKHRFRLIAADEYALRYMELHSNEYPMANVPLIMDKIRRTLASKENGYKNFVAKYMEAVLPNKKELMSVRCFKQALKEVMCEKMTEHEFLTLIRYFRGDPGKEKSPRREMTRSLVFSELTRGLWDDRARLWEGLIHADVNRSGVLPADQLRQILRAHRLPINRDLMDCMLQVLEKDENCNIQYEDLMSFLDFQTRPVFNLTEDDYIKVVRHAPPLKDTECKLWADADTEIDDDYVNWEAFLCQLNLDHLVKEQTQ
ncbi:EF-hand domain-containing family member C2-like [Maniola hyperantus]|uniref:EF-hand domain-containing family member C2-like n=1 Tax=Aphantopus hyperantus TaxID=2795564 RepID=UPI00156841F8|nr:EF-hand domain-containing family member C2-like [Maniola hyperantus]XP_034832364.1 EF-hand domain-containing family member C2-like [Maniola hyperantus]